jgi:predicted dehydrogenase
MTQITRRGFVQGTLAAGATMMLPHSRALGANDQLRVAVVGFHIRGKSLMNQFSDIPGVRVAALCDIDSKLLDTHVRRMESKQGGKVKAYTDYRELMDDKDIDAVAISTPNHWHALMGIWACQAGKHVYVEKPISHNVWEGRQLVQAARKYKRIMATGTQNRSDRAVVPGIKFLKEGNLGEVKLVRGYCYNRRKSTGKVDSPQQAPDHCDYNLWAGPAPMKPLMRKQFHYDWHWDFDYGAGDLGNQGVHELDICRLAAGHDSLPRSVVSAGGRFGYDDDANTPNTLVTLLDYESVPILFEVRGLPRGKGSKSMDAPFGRGTHIVVECENGYLTGGRHEMRAWDKDRKVIKTFPGDGGKEHQVNFINALRSGDSSILTAEIIEGHRSSCLAHLANISYQVGAQSDPATIREQLATSALAGEAYDRMAKHLDANKIDIESDQVTLGPHLEFDSDSERFVNHDAANALLRRECREPFVVPEDV